MDRIGMLHLVTRNDSPAERLALARRHIETAIAHINDVAQSRVPMTTIGSSAGVDELRLIVRALADIREGLRTSEWSSAAMPADARAATFER